MSEKPVILGGGVGGGRGAKKKPDVTSEDRKCILHNVSNTTDDTVCHLSDTNIAKVREVRSLRLMKNDPALRQEKICEAIPTEIDKSIHGFHRLCYQRFTDISKLRLKRNVSTELQSGHDVTAPKRARATSSVLFPPVCIFCSKARKWVSRKKGGFEKLVKCVTPTAAQSVLLAAERQGDENILREIRGIDLVARELQYHQTCRKQFTRDPERHGETPGEDRESAKSRQAHEKAFNFLTDYIDKHIMKECGVERISMLKEKYLTYMQEHSPDSYNPMYTTQKLKEKLIRKYGTQLKFWCPNYRSELVYSDIIPTGQAVETAFEYASSPTRQIEEVALAMRRNIMAFFGDKEPANWPPSSQCLIDKSTELPESVTHFLAFLLSGKHPKKVSSKINRLCTSYGQDLCYTVGQGKWKTAKHLLLGVAIHHLTGSAELVTMLNRYGHCISYSELLILETAMCNAITEANTLVPKNIKRDSSLVLHFCWDNFDLNEETLSGSGTTHTTHGIAIQETQENGDTSTVPEIHTAKTKKRSVSFIPKELTPCFLGQHIEPAMKNMTFSPEADSSLTLCLQDFIWAYSRFQQQEQQVIPGLAGWTSLTSSEPEGSPQSTVEYMAPVMAPATDNSTIQHVLRTSQDVASEVGLPYTIVTFDLAVAKKAYTITWNAPDEYKNVFVRMGVFHTLCSYLGTLGKMLRGSGFSEIIIEAGICAGGSVEKVMMGKHYNRAVRVHKLFAEALERLLFEKFLDQNQAEDYGISTKQAFTALAEQPTATSLETTQSTEAVVRFHTSYEAFKTEVRDGEHGKTAQFWIQYLDKVWLALTFLRATKENDFDLHIKCIEAMCPMFFSYDHQNYARYLSVNLITLVNLSRTLPVCEQALRHNGFSVSRSGVPGSRNAVDITIEQTINRHAKSKGGIIGFSRNVSAYYRWCVTRHTRATYVQGALEMADMSTDEDSAHKDNRPAAVAQSEKDVQCVIAAIRNFMNPFDVEEKRSLYCLSSGARAPDDVARDLLRANSVGKSVFRDFMQKRLVEKSVSLHVPITRNKLKTFASMEKVLKLTTPKKKMVEVRAERNVFAQLVLLSEENKISTEKTLSYPLGPVPWALATADGLPTKTDKSKLMHYLEKDVPVATTLRSDETISIIDGNAMLHSMVQRPENFELLAESVFDTLPRSNRVDFVTDSYASGGIKECEQSRRGQGKTFLIKGSKTKVPRDWQGFLLNAKNKEQLIDLLLREWQRNTYAKKLQGRTVFFVNGKYVTKLTSTKGIDTDNTPVPELCSSHAEADNRIILHCLHASVDNRQSRITIRSPDTDVCMLLLKFARGIPNQIVFDTGVANKRRLIDIKAVVQKHGADNCMAYLSLHALTGCDTVSSFVKKGKISAVKLLEKNRDFVDLFLSFGTRLEITEEALSQLEHFVCCLYGNPTYNDINKLRFDLFRQRFKPKSGQALTDHDGIDISLLPPCRSSLVMHLRRANYQAYIWNSSDTAQPIIPSPGTHGWNVSSSGETSYDWMLGEPLPAELVHILDTTDINPPAEDDTGEGMDIEYSNLADIIYEDD